MEGNACAPAERHPIEPPGIGGGGEVDDEQQDDHRHIGEQVHGEAARLGVDKDALAAPALAQEQCETVRGNADAPAKRDPDEPQVLRGEPEIDAGADQPDDDIGREVRKKARTAGSLNMPSPKLSRNCRLG